MNLRSVDLNLMTVFEAVYEVRSQAKAAAKLNMTQPSVSNAVSRLRHMMGDPLFLGRPHGVEPTQKAHDLYDQIHKALDIFRNEISEKTAFDPETSFRTFSMSVSLTGGLIFGASLYEKFVTEAPNIDLVVRNIDPESEIPGLLHDNKLDVALHFDQFEDPHLRQTVYYEDSLVLIAARNHPRIQSQPTLEDCIRESFASSYNMLSKTQDDALHQMVEIIKVLTTLELPHPLAVFNAVSQTSLLALMNKRLADRFCDLFQVNYFDLPNAIPPLRTYMIWSKNREDDPGHQWFRNVLGHIRLIEPNPPVNV